MYIFLEIETSSPIFRELVGVHLHGRGKKKYYFQVHTKKLQSVFVGTFGEFRYALTTSKANTKAQVHVQRWNREKKIHKTESSERDKKEMLESGKKIIHTHTKRKKKVPMARSTRGVVIHAQVYKQIHSRKLVCRVKI